MIGEIDPGGQILIAEGYATAASLYEATSLTVAVACDCANLRPVGEALRKKYPAAMLIFCADDDAGGLIKQRVARPGRGRSGGFRTLIVFRAKMRSVFVYGFAKSERANIGKTELEFWRTVAAAFLAMDDTQIEAAIAAEELAEVICDDQGEED